MHEYHRESDRSGQAQRSKSRGCCLHQGGFIMDTLTKMVVINSQKVLPSDVVVKLYESNADVMIKETCFGVIVSGERISQCFLYISYLKSNMSFLLNPF